MVMGEMCWLCMATHSSKRAAHDSLLGCGLDYYFGKILSKIHNKA